VIFIGMHLAVDGFRETFERVGHRLFPEQLIEA